MSLLVAQASARRVTRYRRSAGSGTCHSKIANAAHKRGTLGRAKGRSLWHYSDRLRKGPRTFPRGTKLRILGLDNREYAELKLLRAHMCEMLGNARSPPKGGSYSNSQADD